MLRRAAAARMLLALVLVAGCPGFAAAQSTSAKPPSAGSPGPATCFGGPKVLTCFDNSGAPPYQVNCFGNSKYQNCYSSQGQQFSLSNSGAANVNPSVSGAFQSPNGSIPGSSPSADPCPTAASCSNPAVTAVPPAGGPSPPSLLPGTPAPLAGVSR